MGRREQVVFSYKVHHAARSIEYYVKNNIQCKKQIAILREIMGTKLIQLLRFLSFYPWQTFFLFFFFLFSLFPLSLITFLAFLSLLVSTPDFYVCFRSLFSFLFLQLNQLLCFCSFSFAAASPYQHHYRLRSRVAAHLLGNNH